LDVALHAGSYESHSVAGTPPRSRVDHRDDIILADSGYDNVRHEIYLTWQL